MTKNKKISVQITNEERWSRGMSTWREWPTIGAVFNDVALRIDDDGIFNAKLSITPDQEEAFTAFAAEKGYEVRADMMEVFTPSGVSNSQSGPA